MTRKTLITACVLALLALTSSPTWADTDAASRLIDTQGCTGCHSTDGTAGPAPTFLGLAGSQRQVTTAGSIRTLLADEAYLRRSIAEPNADVLAGYAAGLMPTFPLTDTELSVLVQEITTLPSPDEPPPTGSIWWVIFGMTAFVGLHLMLSSHPIRSRLVEWLGEGRFQGAYSVLVLAAMFWAWYAFESAPYIELWQSPLWTRHIPLGTMWLVMIFWVAGYTSKGPAGVAEALAESGEDDGRYARGFIAVTRHPALWGWALWGLFHIPANGDVASLVLFGGFVVLALAGMIHIDRRQRRSLGDERWQELYGRTSILPFGSLILGNTRFSWAEVGAWRIVLGLVLYALILAGGHEWMMDANPLPY